MKLFQTVAGQCMLLHYNKLLSCTHKQKLGKVVDPDDIAMVAKSWLYTYVSCSVCFLQYSYLLVIILLLKNKCGGLSDVNDYRAIAISTSTSKLLESTIASSFLASCC